MSVFYRATGGELQAILDEEGCFTEQQAQSCMREILKALQYLHKKYIAHLDLKPQNILLCGDKVEGNHRAKHSPFYVILIHLLVG